MLGRYLLLLLLLLLKPFHGLLRIQLSTLSIFILVGLPLPLAIANTQPLPPGAPLPHDLFINLAKKINPSVVNISTQSLPKSQHSGQFYRDPFFDMFESFLNPHGLPQRPKPRQNLGTGFIIRKDGLIITNNHVIDKADVINISLSNSNETYIAKVIGKDERTDTALIKIEAKKDLPFAKLGDSNTLQVGEWVAAFGNPFGHSNSMSKGIISAIGREIDQLNRFPFLQTDASINPGNSGGPLVNTKGEVIGVNTAIDARAQGIGFAIPINNIKAILPALERDGGIQRGFLGVNLRDLDENIMRALGLKNTKGSLIINVITGSPAQKSGLQPYDVIVRIGKKEIKSTSSLMNVIADTGIGKAIAVKVIRKGKVKRIKVTLGSHPQNKTLRGQKSPQGPGKAAHKLGFSLMDYKIAINRGLQRQLNLPKIMEDRPVVTSVQSGSQAQLAGLYPGDIILDINQYPVYKIKIALKQLKKPRTHILRILRQNQVELIYLPKPEK